MEGTPGNQRWRVRAAREDDFERWRELYRGYADFYRVPQPEESARLVWSWIHDPRHEFGCLLVEDGQQIAGLAHFRPFARPLSGGTGCYLDDLFVDPDLRGAGAAPALLTELRRLARGKGGTSCGGSLLTTIIGQWPPTTATQSAPAGSPTT